MAASDPSPALPWRGQSRVARRPKPDVWTSFTTRTVEAAMTLFPGFLES